MSRYRTKSIGFALMHLTMDAHRKLASLTRQQFVYGKMAEDIFRLRRNRQDAALAERLHFLTKQFGIN